MLSVKKTLSKILDWIDKPKVSSIQSYNGTYKEIYVNLTVSELGTTGGSLSLEDYLKSAVVNICRAYPNQKQVLFKGKGQHASISYFEVFIYDTNDVDASTGLPRYSFGRALCYAYDRATICTADYKWNTSVIQLAVRSTITATASVITVSSAATIVSASYIEWGKVAQIYIRWTNKSAITVPANGNIKNVTVGTLVAGKRPAITTGAWSAGDEAGPAFYNITNAGVISLGACEGTGAQRTIAAGSTFQVCATYILP